MNEGEPAFGNENLMLIIIGVTIAFTIAPLKEVTVVV